jgi:hypothetical protein
MTVLDRLRGNPEVVIAWPGRTAALLDGGRQHAKRGSAVCLDTRNVGRRSIWRRKAARSARSTGSAQVSTPKLNSPSEMTDV